MDDHAILSFRAAGGLLGDTLGQDELLAAVAGERADAVLLSAGGNDHLGSSQLTRVLGPFGPARDAEGYLGATFDTFLAGALASYRRLVEAVAARDPRLVVAGHGHDPALPAAGRWLGRPARGRARLLAGGRSQLGAEPRRDDARRIVGFVRGRLRGRRKRRRRGCTSPAATARGTGPMRWRSCAPSSRPEVRRSGARTRRLRRRGLGSGSERARTPSTAQGQAANDGRDLAIRGPRRWARGRAPTSPPSRGWSGPAARRARGLDGAAGSAKMPGATAGDADDQPVRPRPRPPGGEPPTADADRLSGARVRGLRRPARGGPRSTAPELRAALGALRPAGLRAARARRRAGLRGERAAAQRARP